MASLTQKERAALYALRLKGTDDPRAEMVIIRKDLDSLVYSINQNPITDEYKVEVLYEVKSILCVGRKSDDGYIIVEASDNSATLDVVDSVINDIKNKK